MKNYINFKIAVENALIGFYISTVDGNFEYVNPHLLKVFGYDSLEELKKVNIPKDIYVSEKERENFLNKLRSEGKVDSIKLKIKRKNGDIRDIILSGRLVEDKKIEGWIIDITEHEKVKKEHNLYIRIIEENSDAIFITDAKGFILYKNKKFHKIVGDITENLYAKDILPVTGDVRTKIKEIINEIKIKGHWIGELDVINDKNELIPCGVKIFALFDKQGNIENYISVFRDIRDKMELENQLKHAQKMELIGTMTGSLIHDMNNILTGIGYSTELIRMIGTTSPEKIEKYISRIEKSIENATSMLQKVLRFTRKTKITKEAVKLSEIINDLKALATPILKKEKKIQFKIDINCEDCMFYGSKSSMVQVLLNLVINARDAIIEAKVAEGNINLLCDKISIENKSFIRIAISDNGKGIDSNLKDKIFEPFFSTKSGSKSGAKGTGLGLAIVLREIKEMGGAIDFISKPGEGTEFIVTIPEYSSKSKDSADYHISVEATKKANKVIGILDDDDYFRNSLVDILKFYGFDVISMSGSNDFFSTIETNKIDLLILDFVLDNSMNGEDILKYLKDNEKRIPVFLITGYIDSTILELKKYKCVKNILEKPVTGNELVTKINSYFHKK